MRKSLLFVLIVGLFWTMASPASAFEIEARGWKLDFNAQIYLPLYYTVNNDVPAENGTGVDDGTEMTYGLGQSRLIFNFQNDKYKGLFEFRANGEDTTLDTIYYYWVEYNFGMGRVLVGCNDPITWDAILLPPPLKSGISHMLGHYPNEQIRLSFPVSNDVELQFAALRPDDWSESCAGGYIVDGAVDSDNEIPSLEARLNWKFGKFKLGVSGGYDIYTEEVASGKEYDIESYMYGASLRYFAPKVILEATLYADHNNYSHGGPPNQKGYNWFYAYTNYRSDYYGDPRYDATSDSIISNDYLGYALGVNWFINPKNSVHFGVSQGFTEDDQNNKDKVIGYDFIYCYKMTEYMTLIPFINLTDWQDRKPAGEAAVDEGTTTNVGCQIMFLF